MFHYHCQPSLVNRSRIASWAIYFETASLSLTLNISFLVGPQPPSRAIINCYSLSCLTIITPFFKITFDTLRYTNSIYSVHCSSIDLKESPKSLKRQRNTLLYPIDYNLQALTFFAIGSFVPRLLREGLLRKAKAFDFLKWC